MLCFDIGPHAEAEPKEDDSDDEKLDTGKKDRARGPWDTATSRC